MHLQNYGLGHTVKKEGNCKKLILCDGIGGNCIDELSYPYDSNIQLISLGSTKIAKGRTVNVGSVVSGIMEGGIMICDGEELLTYNVKELVYRLSTASTRVIVASINKDVDRVWKLNFSYLNLNGLDKKEFRKAYYLSREAWGLI